MKKTRLRVILIQQNNNQHKLNCQQRLDAFI
jgi:hypothetical protein